MPEAACYAHSATWAVVNDNAANALPCPAICSNLASDDGMQQLQYILNGMFGRACKNLGNPEAIGQLLKEVGDVRDTLVHKLAGEAACCDVLRCAVHWWCTGSCCDVLCVMLCCGMLHFAQRGCPAQAPQMPARWRSGWLMGPCACALQCHAELLCCAGGTPRFAAAVPVTSLLHGPRLQVYTAQWRVGSLR